MKPQLLFLLFFPLLLRFPALTAGDDFHFRHYTNQNGLSHNTVYCILQDRQGFMWFGTEDGLNRFDGRNFRVYRHNSYADESLPHDKILHIAEDSSGKIWICTSYATCYYDPATERFHPLPFSDKEHRPGFFLSVAEDGQKNLWFRNYDQVVRYSPDRKQVAAYPYDARFTASCLAIDHRGNPFCGGADRLFFYHAETDRFNAVDILNEEDKQLGASVSAVCEMPGTGVLAGTDRAGLKLYRYASGQAETVIPQIQVRAIAAFDSTTYWIASESGIYLYRPDGNRYIRLQKSLTDTYAIADNAVYALAKDREGGMWAGFFFGGISYLPAEYVRFNPFIGGKTHTQMLGNAVREICPDRYGYLWLGTEDNGINRYSPLTGQMTNFSLDNPQRPLSATNIHGLLADGNRLWVGTFNRGIDLLEIPSGRLAARYTFRNTRGGLKSDFVLCFTPLENGDLLIGTAAGTVRYRKEANRFEPWKNISSLVRQIYRDSRGEIWIVSNNGLYRHRNDPERLVRYTADRENPHTLGSNDITSVFEDSRRRIWVTTTHGFSRFDEQTDSFDRITTENGLPSNIVYRILEDSSGLFWISTANGLVRFDPRTYVIRTFGYTDGLHETQFNYCSSYKAPDGTMYMGTINGMVSFRPESFREDTFCPPLIIQCHTWQPGGNKPVSRQIGAPADTLHLPYGGSTFNLSFTALSYTAPAAIRYAYRLDGSGKEWIYTRGHGEVTFANLPPGDYVFRVKSTNSSGIWQDNEKKLYVSVAAPWWASGWARAGYVVSATGLIAAIYLIKKRKLDEQQRLRQERFEIKKDKEFYQAKMRFFTFVAHEIRTPLMLIQAPLEKIIDSGDGSTASRENLHLIRKNTQHLLDLSNQLLDFRKMENHEFRFRFTETDLSLWLHNLLRRFEPVMEKENKQLFVEMADSPLPAEIDRDAFFKIAGNLLTNAVKYSDRMIRVCLNKGPAESFTLSIDNDGKNIPAGEREKIFEPFYRSEETGTQPGSGMGLPLARNLAQLHGGSLIYCCSSDGMNRFTLTLPRRQRETPAAESGKPPYVKEPAVQNEPAPAASSHSRPEQKSGCTTSRTGAPLPHAPITPGIDPDDRCPAPSADAGFSGPYPSCSIPPITFSAPANAAATTGAGQETAEDSSGAIQGSRPTGRWCVLVVEDHPDMRTFIARELGRTFHVSEADNGQTALSILHGRQPVHAIVSDIKMPVMDGFQFCNRVKNDLNFSHIPFILLTARPNLSSRLEGLGCGADAYLEKPFSIDLLEAQIRNLLKNRETLNRAYLEKPFIPVTSLAVSQTDNSFLQKLHTFLDHHLADEEFSVEMLASGLGLSASSLYRKVKAISGMPPVDFIRVARLKKAVRLMSAGETRINEVAFRVGFSSPAYFSTCFLKQYGKTPSEFMKEREYPAPAGRND